MTTVPLLAADGDRPDTGQHADAPHVVVQMLAADTDVPERSLARPDAVGECPQPCESGCKCQPAEQGRPLPWGELLIDGSLDRGRRRRMVGHIALLPRPLPGAIPATSVRLCRYTLEYGFSWAKRARVSTSTVFL